jgi:hypothetical protein
MAVKEDNSAYVPQRNAYGRIFRERGTLRIVIGAIVLAIAWYIYDSIHTNMMNQVKWPELQPSTKGLTVLGLRDKDRTGWRHKYEARESNHSWQIRYRDDEVGGDTGGDSKEETPEARDRGTSNPGATHTVNGGAVVPLEELLKNCPVVLNGANFTGASVDEKYESFTQRSYYAVTVDLNEEGRSRYWQFSSKHEKERLAFLLDGEVLTCPRMDTMYVSSLTIDPIWVKADAYRLADFINKQKK